MKIRYLNVPVRSDNQAAINGAVSEKLLFTRSKYIDLRVHIVRELVKKTLGEVLHVPEEKNDANLLTKPFEPAILCELINETRLRPETKEEFQ